MFYLAFPFVRLEANRSSSSPIRSTVFTAAEELLEETPRPIKIGEFQFRYYPRGKQTSPNRLRWAGTLKVTAFSPQSPMLRLYKLHETALVSDAELEASSLRRICNCLIPCNLRKSRLFRNKDQYRGFESLSLRHAV